MRTRIVALTLLTVCSLAAAASWAVWRAPAASGASAHRGLAHGPIGRQADNTLLDMVMAVPGGDEVDVTSPQEAFRINASIPFSQEPNPPAAPFRLKVDNGIDYQRALNCLTLAVYYEAGFEPAGGPEAVAQVVLNRLRHPAYPKTICGVVFQGSSLPTGCQFTFTCDGSLARPPSPVAWTRAQKVAARALDGAVEKSVGLATHYHTLWVAPAWGRTLVKVRQVGGHLFYRWPGPWGRPAAFTERYAGREPWDPLGGAAGVIVLASVVADPDPPLEGGDQAGEADGPGAKSSAAPIKAVSIMAAPRPVLGADPIEASVPVITPPPTPAREAGALPRLAW